MIAPVPVPPCGQCYDLTQLWRPWTWPPSTHPVPFPGLHGRPAYLRRVLDRLPAALDPSKP